MMNLPERALKVKYLVNATLGTPQAMLLPAGVKSLITELAELVSDLSIAVHRLQDLAGQEDRKP